MDERELVIELQNIKNWNSTINQDLDKIDKRIEALESKFDTRIISNYNHIRELEGWTENFTEDMAIKLTELRNQIQNNSIVDLNHFEIFTNWSRAFEQAHNHQIEELREKLEKTEEEYENALTEHERHIVEDLLEPKLNELKDLFTSTQAFNLNCFEGLKERNVYYHHWVQSKLDEYDNRILISEINREVLMEFFKKMLHYSQIADFPSDQAHTNLRDFYKQELEKLDVGKTEKKASGGEKEDRARLVRPYSNLSEVKSADNQSENSKPPEPIRWQYDTDPEVQPREDLYTCRLCGNEITLVEHEVSKLTVEVKREDLIKWFKRIEHFLKVATEGEIPLTLEYQRWKFDLVKDEEAYKIE